MSRGRRASGSRKRRAASPARSTAKKRSAPRGGVARARAGAVLAEPDLSAADIDAIASSGLGPKTRISAHFRLYELTRSKTADRHSIANAFPSERELHSAIYLAREVLDRIRVQFGPFTPNSVFRGQPLERALKNKPAGWISMSQHTKGEACDIEIVGESTLSVAKWAAAQLPKFDQIICECFDPAKGPSSGWVHISLVRKGHGVNRGQCLSYVKDEATGNWIYVDGLRGTLT